MTTRRLEPLEDKRGGADKGEPQPLFFVLAALTVLLGLGAVALIFAQ